MLPPRLKQPASCCKDERDKFKIVLIILNTIYLLFGCVLVGCVIWHHQNAWVALYPIITIQGVFGGLLAFMSIFGSISVVIQKTKCLFTYCAILGGTVVALLALGGICMAATSSTIIPKLSSGWRGAATEVKQELQMALYCCGFEDPNLGIDDPHGHPPCEQLSCCERQPTAACCTGRGIRLGETCPCNTCDIKLERQTLHTVKVAGSISLICAMFVLFGTGYTLVQILHYYRKERLNADAVPQEEPDDTGVNYERF